MLDNTALTMILIVLNVIFFFLIFFLVLFSYFTYCEYKAIRDTSKRLQHHVDVYQALIDDETHAKDTRDQGWQHPLL